MSTSASADSGAGAGAGAGGGASASSSAYPSATADVVAQSMAAPEGFDGSTLLGGGGTGDGNDDGGGFDGASEAGDPTAVLSPPLGHHPVPPAGLIPAFLKKTYDMLETPELRDCVRWGEDGASIVIKKSADFGNVALPRFFKHRNYGSFVRQLNIYGFRKVSSLPGYAEFKHPEFRRGNLAGIITMKRRVTKPAKKKGSSQRHAVDDVIKELVALKQRQRQVEVHVNHLTKANRQLLMDNQVLWRQVNDSRERQARLQARMRKLLVILLNVFQFRSRGQQPALAAVAASMSAEMDEPSTSLVVSSGPNYFPSASGGGSGSGSAAAAASTTTTTQVQSVSAPPAQSTPVISEAGTELHGEAPVHHPFYKADGHLDPDQLHSAIHFLGIHHDDPAHPTHPSAGVTPHHESELHPSLHGHPITPPNVPPTSTAAAAAAAAAPSARKRQRTTEPSAAEQVPYTVTVPHDEATTTSAPTKVVHTPAVVELQSSLAQDEAAMLDRLGLFEEKLADDINFDELDSLFPANGNSR